ncbi:MAG: MerR family transcriptional regulator [Burkholderiales bacterium]|nr:MerR family transcriptional regulator [Burkholderiales bacterium]MDE1928467.1 MerR family transcriptional regulator [Burkholderiales bacterium]MDE2158319.1 MerR family transcriptional regulator [Burkholderiales bacterium]MDE2501826.1 MerR family transcriptional regulator [Burkholderiales bacterium]
MLIPYACTESSDAHPPIENLTIGAFARAVAVHVETIRFYWRKGLLPEPRKPAGGIRRHGAADMMRMQFVKAARRLGFSRDEIAELLRLDDGTHCWEACRLAQRQQQDMRQRLADLGRMEAALSDLTMPPAPTSGLSRPGSRRKTAPDSGS